MRGLLRASSVGTIWLCALIVPVVWWNAGLLAVAVLVFGLTFVGKRG